MIGPTSLNVRPPTSMGCTGSLLLVASLLGRTFVVSRRLGLLVILLLILVRFVVSRRLGLLVIRLLILARLVVARLYGLLGVALGLVRLGNDLLGGLGHCEGDDCKLGNVPARLEDGDSSGERKTAVVKCLSRMWCVACSSRECLLLWMRMWVLLGSAVWGAAGQWLYIHMLLGLEHISSNRRVS